MIKINILTHNFESKNLDLFYGYWKFFFIYEKELNDLNLKINFFFNINKKFLEADYIFINSRVFPQNNNYVDLNKLKELSEKHKNLIWFDMRDSAGTTQFEVLPFVKKYVKKQGIFKNINLYNTNLKGGRYYTNYYINKYNLKDNPEYEYSRLDLKYKNKLIIGWNVGVEDYFDFINFNQYHYLKELISFKFFRKRTYSYLLKNYQNWDQDDKKEVLNIVMNSSYNRKSIAFGRNFLKKKILETKYNKSISNIGNLNEKRMSLKNYYKLFQNTKITICPHGWGEIGNREFLASKLGSAFIKPDMSYIDTWPNIYINNETYIPCDLDYSNIENIIDELSNNKNLRKRLVDNSLSIINDINSEKGKLFFLRKVNEIIS